MIHAIVTGHSRGLGAAIAEHLLARGARVLGLSRRDNPELAARFPSTLSEAQVDLADSAALARWLEGGALGAFLAGAERVALINNAGMLGPVGPLGTQAADGIACAVALNVAAPLILANALVAATPTARERRILHVSSGVARRPLPGWSVYCATKAAVDHHARTVAGDALPGVMIASLAPGVIDTDMQAQIRASDVANFPMLAHFEALKREGQLSSPQDCAQRLVDYLLAERFRNGDITDLREL